jgi:CHASE2 domain-containing sensor protein
MVQTVPPRDSYTALGFVTDGSSRELGCGSIRRDTAPPRRTRTPAALSELRCGASHEAGGIERYSQGPEGANNVIALDVIFRGARDPGGDGALLRAIRATHDRLVLAYQGFTVAPQPEGYQTVLLPDLFGRPGALQATGVRTGYAGLPDDQDGRNRRVDYEEDIASIDRKLQTFAFAAADVARGGALWQEQLPAATRRAVGGQSERTTWIDYRGPPGTIRRVSALDVLDGRVASGAFAGKVVVIGVVSRRNGDVLRTPLDGGHGMSGPEVQANALDTILRGAPLRDVSRLVEIIVLVLLACLPAVAWLSRSGRVAAAAIVAAVVVFLVGAQLAFDGGRIVAVVAPLAALLIAALGVAALAVARTVRRRRAGSSTRAIAGQEA